MSGLSARNRILYADLEPAYNDGTVPTQAIETSDLKITPLAGNSVDRNRDRGQLGNDMSVLVGSWVEVTFKVECNGSGTVDVPPVFGSLLKACAMAETITAATNVTYNPVSSNYDSVALNCFYAGNRHILNGARGTVSVQADAGDLMWLLFRFVGLYAIPDTVPAPAENFNQQPSLPVNNDNTSIAVHGVNVVMEKFQTDLANEIVYRNVVGAEYVAHFDRAPAGALEFEAPSVSVQNWFEIARANTLGPVILNHGTVAGSRVKSWGQNVQLILPDYTGDEILLVNPQTAYQANGIDQDWLLIFD